MDKKTLLKKFFDNKCSEEEAILANRIMEEEPSLIDEFESMQEWDDVQARLSEATKKEIWEHVDEAARRNSKNGIQKSRILLMKPLTAAAGVLLIGVIAVVLMMFFKKETSPQMSATVIAMPVDSSYTIENTETYKKDIMLADGSLVTLYPGAAIQYGLNFERNRLIMLTGKAFFKVEKDTLYPFTVYSGMVSTTALGTSFLVDNTNEETVNVRLYEGKVVVKSLVSRAEDTYLLPGQQCHVLRSDGKLWVTLMKRQSTIAQHGVASFDDTVQIAQYVMEIQFDNVPLPDVFERLSFIFKEGVHYKENDVAKKYFTGSFKTSDSLQGILQVIALMNGLNIDRDAGEFHIVKSISPKPVSASVKKTQKPEKPDESGFREVNKEGNRYQRIPLKQVFSDIETLWSVKIQFKEPDLSNKYFTGAISASEDVNVLLQVICKMNRLKLETDSITYIISK